MWLSYKTIVYKHVPAKFLRRKRNEKLRQKINATNLLSLFHIKHPAAAHAMKGGQLTAVPKSKAKNGIRAQAHHQTSQGPQQTRVLRKKEGVKKKKSLIELEYLALKKKKNWSICSSWYEFPFKSPS